MAHKREGILVTNNPLRFVILASGAGSNARNLFEHARAHSKSFEPCALISDRAGIPALEIAKDFQVPSYVVAGGEENQLIELLQKLQPTWAFLAGYKKIVGKKFLDFFYDATLGASRVMNVHPSLLPAYPGLGAYERAFRDGVQESGVTVHLVDAGVDTGRVLLQEKFSRAASDTLESFEAKGRELEKKLFKEAMDLAVRGKIQ